MTPTLLPALREALSAGGVGAARAIARALGEPLGPRLGEALRLSEAALDADPGTLEAQLLGRLDGRSPEERALLDACDRDALGLVPLRASLTTPFPLVPTVLGQHSRDVNCLCALPDGDRVISGSEDGTLRVWSLTKGGELARLSGHQGPVNRVALAADGETFVTAGDDQTVRVWSARSLDCLHTLVGHKAYVRDAAISDAHVLTASEDKRVRVWDRDQGALLATLEGHGEHPSAVAIHPDGRIGVSSSIDNDLLRWDLTERRADGAVYKTEFFVASIGRLYIAGGEAPAHGHRDGAKVLAFTEGGDLLSASGELIRWNPDLKTARWEAPHAWPIEDFVALEDAGCVVTASAGLQVIDLETGARRGTLPGPPRRASAVAVTPDGRQLIVGGDKGEVWAIPFALDRVPQERHDGYVYALAVSPDGRRAASMDSNNTPALWDLQTGRQVARLDAHPESGSRPFAWLPDGRLLTCRQYAKGADEPNLFLWDADGRALGRFRVEQSEGRAASVHALADLGGGRVLIGNLGEGLWQLDLSSGASARLGGQTKQISCALASGDHAVTLGYFDPPAKEGEPRARFGDAVTQLQGWDLKAGRLLWTVAATKPPDVSWGGSFSDVRVRGGRVFHSVAQPYHRVDARSLRTGEVLESWSLPGWCAQLSVTDSAQWALVGPGEETPTCCLYQLLDGGGVRPSPTPEGLDRVYLDAAREQILGVIEGTLTLLHFSGEVLARLRLDAGLTCADWLPGEAGVVVGDAAGGVHVLGLR